MGLSPCCCGVLALACGLGHPGCLSKGGKKLLQTSPFVAWCCCLDMLSRDARGMHQPCAPLVKSLYGHPLASASWQLRLARILADDLKGTEFENLPSCYWFPEMQLALSVYVDDLTFSGPAENHEKFWELLRKKVQLEVPLPLTHPARKWFSSGLC